MAGFLYFRPQNTNPITRDELVRLGLGYAFPQGVAATVCMGETPTKTAGLVFGDPRRQGEQSVRMDMAQQRWRKLPGSAIYCGLWTAAPPVPADLAREPQMPGYLVRLADGHEWLVPVVRRFDRDTRALASALPCYMECDEAGNWHRGPAVALHDALWQLTAPVADALVAEYVEGAPGQELTDAEIFAAIVALLGANYVVGAGELSLMRALTSEASVHAAVMAACDWPTFEAWSLEQKKTDSPAPAAGSITSAGAAA